MRLVLTILFSGISVLLNAQLDSCDRLFMKFNLQYLSYKTTGLVISELYENCTDQSFRPNARDKYADKNNSRQFTPGLGGVSQVHHNESNYNVQVISTVDSIVNNGNTWIATEPLQDSLDNMENEEIVQNQTQTNSQDNTAQNQNQSFQVISGNRRIRWASSRLRNPFTGKPFRINNAYTKPFYSRNEDYFVSPSSQTELDSLLGERLSKVGKEYNDCVVTGGKKGDCFNKVVLSPFSGEVEETKQQAQIKKNIGSGMSDKKADEIVNKELVKDPNLFTISKSSLSKAQKKQLDLNFNTKLDSIESKKEKEAKEILEAGKRISEKIEKQIDTLKMEQGKLKDQLAILKNNTDNISDIGNQINPDSLKTNRLLIESSKEAYTSFNDILFSGRNALERLQLRANCLEGRFPCPPGFARAMGEVGTQTRQAFEAVSSLHSKFAEINNFSSQINKIKTGLNAGIDFASSLNLSNSDQEKIAIGFHYAEAGLNTALGFARAYRGDPQGLLQGIEGLTGLIGGPLKPKPSPEMQAIMQLREEMHGRFDNLEMGMDNILQQQVEIGKNLASNIQFNRELMQFEFSNITYELADIKNRQGVMLSQLVTLNNADYNNCKTIYNNIQLDPVLKDLKTYKNYQQIFQANLTMDDCLTGLTGRLNDSGINNNLPSLSYFTVAVGGSDYIDDEFETFKKLATFYEWFYGTQLNNLDRAVDLLLMPADIISESHRIYRDFRNESLVDFNLNKNEILNKIFYLDPYGFRDFISLFTSFYPYFEIAKGGGNSEPRELNNFISYSSQVPAQGETNLKNSSLISLENQLGSMTKVHDIILAQQALMSGTNLLRPFYAIIYENQYDNETINYNSINFSAKQLAIDILAKNPIFAQNFAVFALRKNFRLNEKIYLDTSIWQNGMSRNPSLQAFLESGYDNLPIYSYFPNDSIAIHYDSLTSVNIANLYEAQYIDSLLHFDEWTQGGKIAVLDINITGQSDCTNNALVSCKASIPFPESSIVLLDKFTFTAGYEHSLETLKFLDELRSDILYGRSIPNDWQKMLNLKYTFIPTP